MRVEEMRREFAETVASIEPRLLSPEDARAALEHVTAIKNMASRLGGRLARRAAQGTEWRKAGFASEAEWLASINGSSQGAAKDTLETADRVEDLDAVADAADRGELSPEQLSMIADAAAANPAVQERLLNDAKTKPLSKLRESCARAKQAADPDPDATHERVRAARRLRFAKLLDGAAQILGITTADQMAPIKAAIERRANELFHAARLAGCYEPREAYQIDALEQICREWLEGGRADDEHNAEPVPDDPDSEGEESAAPAPAAGPRRSAGPAWLGLLRIDLEALLRGAVEGEELCEITGLGPIPVSVARRLQGESVLKLVITRGVDVAHVTHLGRGPTVAQKMALLWTSPGCCVTACARMAGIEADHRIDWADTHHTVLGELQHVCDHHHDLKSHESWAFVHLADGAIECVPPDDPRHPRNADARAGPDPPAVDGDDDDTNEPTLFHHDAA